MKFSITHQTRYRYTTSAKKSIQCIRMTPPNLPHQRILSWQLSLPALGAEFRDGFGNICTTLSLNKPHTSLRITAEGEVEIAEHIDYLIDNRLPESMFKNPTALTHCNEEMREFAAPYLAKPDRSSLQEFSAAIAEAMPYTPGATKVNTKAEDSFALGKGVCQDHTHVFLACARDAGLAARYVSGYLYLQSDDHLSSHAWAEVFLDGGWYVFDVSNQLFRPQQHVQLAIGLDYNDAAPVRGMRQGGGEESMDFAVWVQTQQSQQ